MPFDLLCCVRPGVEDVLELDYSHQSLADVPTDVFVYERTLETLLCQSNHISELPRQLFMCHGLKHLDLSDNELPAIPNAISSLVYLRYLNISRNALSSVPDTMKALKYLAFLDLSVNPLEKLPDAITNLIALQELYLNDAYLEYLPGNFGRLTNLRILELRENYLMILPKSLSRSSELIRLDIGQNEFQQFPEVIGRFLKLKELWIDSNSITSIPAFIKPLENLIHLEASNNMIEDVAAEIGYCTQLVDVCLSSNSLTQLPESIGKLSKLTTLKLDNNKLYSLPDSIGQLVNLEELMLMSNYLDKIPSSIGLLRKLQYLNIDENLLRTIPPEIGSCSNMSVLSLRSNKLTSIPSEIGHLSSLKVLNLVRNSLSCLPQSLLNCNNLVALWLSENQSKPLVPMHSEVDPQTYEQVLTCFLFPQVPLSPMESKYDHDKNETILVPAPSRHISFVDMKVALKVSDKPGQLRRAPTPYPKELRALAKHARNIHKDGTQDISPATQNAVHIKAAKITPTLQQRFASDNKIELENVDREIVDNSIKNELKVGLQDNILTENPYDKPLDLNYEQDKTYRSVDHALYPENNDENTSNYRVLLEQNPNTDHESRDEPFCEGRSSRLETNKHLSSLLQNVHLGNKNMEENYKCNEDVFKKMERSSCNEIHNLRPHDRHSNNHNPHHLSHHEEASYSQMPLIDNRPTYHHLNARNDNLYQSSKGNNYHGSVYSNNCYASTKEEICGRRSYEPYRRHAHGHHDLPTPSVNTVSGSTTLPNLSNYSNIYGGRSVEHHYFTVPENMASSPNANVYSLSSPTYVATQSAELYSPTGHTDLTNPYRMSHTPLVSDDGSHNNLQVSFCQNACDGYNSSSVTGSQHSPNSVMSEPLYGRGQPPPYHIAAPYTKQAQYFNSTG